MKALTTNTTKILTVSNEKNKNKINWNFKQLTCFHVISYKHSPTTEHFHHISMRIMDTFSGTSLVIKKKINKQPGLNWRENSSPWPSEVESLLNKTFLSPITNMIFRATFIQHNFTCSLTLIACKKLEKKEKNEADRDHSENDPMEN